MNIVILVGRLTRDPELKYVPTTGAPVTRFSLAVDRQFTGKDGKKEVDFIEIQTWGKVAENCANYLTKGSQVAIEGSLRIESYKNEAGENRKATKVNAAKVQFLNTKGKTDTNQEFEPTGLDSQGFQAIDDDDLPF